MTAPCLNRSKVDFWAFRARDALGPLQAALAGVFAGSQAQLRVQYRKTGWKGYEASADILLGDMSVGILAHAGQNQRGWAYVGISGRGCDFINDWDRAQEAVKATEGYELKRVDIAVDSFDSKGFDKCLAAYRAGAFIPAGQGGRPPKCRTIQGEGDEDGSTIYVGSRERDKFFRGYEKGKQLLGPSVSAAFRRDPESSAWTELLQHRMPVLESGKIVLHPTVDWFRHELELKPKTAPLPEDLIDKRDQYFAGAYPYLSTVLQGVDVRPLIIKRERGPQLDLALALCNARRMFGDTLFTALVAHHGDISAVWTKIVGKKHSDALLRAGVLLVEHD